MTTLLLGPPPARRALLNRRIRWFVTATVSYDVVGAVIALAAGTHASPSALIGFGLDSVVEAGSAAAVAWQFAGATLRRANRSRCESSPSPLAGIFC